MNKGLFLGFKSLDFQPLAPLWPNIRILSTQIKECAFVLVLYPDTDTNQLFFFYTVD